jgi:hypothetical protein
MAGARSRNSEVLFMLILAKQADLFEIIAMDHFAPRNLDSLRCHCGAFSDKRTV